MFAHVQPLELHLCGDPQPVEPLEAPEQEAGPEHGPGVEDWTVLYCVGGLAVTMRGWRGWRRCGLPGLSRGGQGGLGEEYSVIVQDDEARI